MIETVRWECIRHYIFLNHLILSRKDWKHENMFFQFLRVKLCSHVSDIKKNYGKVFHSACKSFILSGLLFDFESSIFFLLIFVSTLENNLVWTFNKPIFHNFRSPFFWRLNLWRAMAKAWRKVHKWANVDIWKKS